jgi:hypothetical protein
MRASNERVALKRRGMAVSSRELFKRIKCIRNPSSFPTNQTSQTSSQLRDNEYQNKDILMT